VEKLIIDSISKSFNKREKRNILDGINFKITKGEMIAITGPSGSGKSTLLNIIGCIDFPDEGSIYVDNIDVKSLSMKEIALLRNQTFGYVFQNFLLLPQYTVYENIELPLYYRKTNKKTQKKDIMETIQYLGLSELYNKYPSELSGGQQQRVAIGRALVGKPDIILADEPTGSLDQENGKMVLNYLKDLNSKGSSIIIVTHDHFIANQCNRIINLVDGKIKDI